MQGMCESMEPISKMWGAAFRPRIWRSALLLGQAGYIKHWPLLVLSLHMRGQRSRVMKIRDDYPRTKCVLCLKHEPEGRVAAIWLAQAELKIEKIAPPSRIPHRNSSQVR